MSIANNPPRPAAGSAERAEAVARIVAEIRAGVRVEEGFRRLIGFYLRPIQAFFARRGFSPEDAGDLTQETLVGIYRGIGSLREDAGFDAWVFAIATNAWKKRLRGQLTIKRNAEEISLDAAPPGSGGHAGDVEGGRAIVLPSSDPAPEELALRRERAARLRAAIAALPEQMRACVILRVERELAVQEIALLLGRSAETVKAHLFQAKKKLRIALADEGARVDGNAKERS